MYLVYKHALIFCICQVVGTLLAVVYSHTFSSWETDTYHCGKYFDFFYWNKLLTKVNLQLCDSIDVIEQLPSPGTSMRWRLLQLVVW